MTDTPTQAQYACDTCRSRKATCCRSQPACSRCVRDSVECVYSRSGIIRRKKRRRDDSESAGPSHKGKQYSQQSNIKDQDSDPENHHGEVQSHLVGDIEATRRLLQGFGHSPHNSLGALSSLSDACATVWHNAPDHGQSPNASFFLFEDKAEAWAHTFTTTLQKGHPILACKPSSEVLEHLRASRPHLVKERAWLVMYYSVILSMVSSTTPADTSTKEKLRCNLWLVVNDIRILLEPSEENIQALALLATHVEEFTSPSLCWMLIASACRMLQALGINLRHLSPETRQRRTMTFWYLNLVDKGLSVIFGRPPTFHRAMARDIPPPSVVQLLPYQPHSDPTEPNAGVRPVSLFGAHYVHQIMLLSYIMGDIWSCVYENASPDEEAIGSAKIALESWYSTAKPLLEAAAMAEKPLLGANGTKSIDLGIYTLDFNRHYLLVLLGRMSAGMKEDTIHSAKAMLHLLKHLVSDSEEVYNGIVWQLVCCPFTPFLTLFGETLASKDTTRVQNEEALMAMKELPLFLQKMGVRNSLAARLENIAVVFVQHAESVVHPPQDSHLHSDAQILNGYADESWPTSVNEFDWDAFLNHTTTASCAGQSSNDLLTGDYELSGGSGETMQWPNSFLGDASIDWIGLGDSFSI